MCGIDGEYPGEAGSDYIHTHTYSVISVYLLIMLLMKLQNHTCEWTH